MKMGQQARRFRPRFEAARTPSRIIGFLVNHYDSSVINGLLTGDLILEMGALTQNKGMGQTG